MQRLFRNEPASSPGGPVECLGLAFENDEARRAYFLDRLREKLADPTFRAIEGFPIGSDEDILRLSDPPYYTACPNPFLADFIAHYGRPYDEATDDYHREPFAADVSEGKNDPIYNAHSYHTKVPHKAIMRYILHYTKPGDIVFDGFCGTGMTGVAAQLSGKPDTEFRVRIEHERKGAGWSEPRWGARAGIVSDLSPVASFIAHNYNTPLDVASFRNAAESFFEQIAAELEWLYQTRHTNGKKYRINYTVWSEVFQCQSCANEIVFLDEALNKETGEVSRGFECPHCGASVSKRSMMRLLESFYDTLNGALRKRVKRVPVLINYTVEGKKVEKKPDEDDLALLNYITNAPVEAFFPTTEMPYMHVTHIKDKMSNFGISHFSHFFLPRSQYALAIMWKLANQVEDARMRHALTFMVEQCNWGMSVFARYVPTHFSQVNQYLSGVFYISSQLVDVSPWYILEGKFQRLVKVFEALPKYGNVLSSLNSGVTTTIPTNAVDYIFTDPPFGENLQYSELNWLIEEFLRVRPSVDSEAVINQAQKKGVAEYQELMARCFAENYRVLKPGRWMTVEFHNSKNSVWNSIQEAIQRAGFVVADVRVLDKRHQTYKQAVQGVVKQDLVISAYKPRHSFTERFEREAGTEQGAFDFVTQHLAQLPIFIETGGKVELIAERQNYLLYDRMIAFHIERGATIPLSAAEFYASLRQRFPERDGMSFLPQQVAEYDQKRLAVAEVEQLALFIRDEQSTIQWLRQELSRQRQTYQDLHPKFLRELRQARHEQLPELAVILDQNFLKDERDRWYVPDPARQIDLERLREKALLREFEAYKTGRGKLKIFRSDAVRAGFKAAWRAQGYATIVRVAQRLPDAVLQEDPQLLMYYDNAADRVEESGQGQLF